MNDALERLRFDALVPFTIAATVFAVACGSSSVHWLNSIGKPARWVLLVVLVVVAGASAWTRRARWPLTRGVTGAVAALLALAFLSTGWSVEPRLTFERAVSIALVLAAAVLLAAGQPPERVLAGLLAGAAAVALAGLVVLALDKDAAVSPASYEVPARYQGLGENPNTVPLLLALATPIALALLLRGRRRWLLGATLLLLVASTVASTSRGGLAAAAVGALVVVAAGVRGVRARSLAAAAVVAVAAIGTYIESLPQPTPIHAAAAARPASAQPAAARKPPRYLDADGYYPLDADVGGPLPGGGQPTLRRSFLGSSGRVDAWIGAVHQAAQRPLLGFGFGTEADVFVDRYYNFVGGRPENAYIGLALQLGLLGLLAFLAIVASVAAAGIRIVRASRASLVPAAGLGVLAAGLVLAVVQSYLYSAGDIATLTFWTGLLLLPAALREMKP